MVVSSENERASLFARFGRNDVGQGGVGSDAWVGVHSLVRGDGGIRLGFPGHRPTATSRGASAWSRTTVTSSKPATCMKLRTSSAVWNRTRVE